MNGTVDAIDYQIPVTSVNEYIPRLHTLFAYNF